MTKHTQAIRKRIVTSVEVNHVKADDPFFPKVILEAGEEQKETWWVWVRERSGLLPETSRHMVFYSEREANDFAARHSAGTELDELKLIGGEARRHEYIRGLIDKQRIPAAGHAGDEESPLAFNILDEAGITKGFSVSQMVVDCLGKQRLGILKNKHGENWRVAAAFEYCWLNLPSSSPAYVAAAYQFHWYITRDEFAAGYLWRDLECLVHGVESAAVKSLEMRKNAGAAGSKKSAQARLARRVALMGAVEVVAKRNPDVLKLGAKVVADLALAVCVEKAPDLWTQGQGQIDDYLGEIRRGEAGQELQARFRSLFPEKLPKRLRP